MFIVSITYTRELSAVDKLIDEHVRYLDEQYAAGHFLASGRKVPRTGGVILAQVASRSALDLILQQDPFYQADMADYDVTEFVPSKVAEGLTILQE